LIILDDIAKEYIQGKTNVIVLNKLCLNVNYDENTMNLISEIINETKFKESNVFNFKNINDDFNNKQNIDKIWLLCKYYLMIEGFKKRYNSININLEAEEKSNLLNS